MLEKIKNCKKQVVCYVDPETGYLEAKYSRLTTKTIVPVGGEFTIIRDGIETLIRRVNATAFEVESVSLVA